MERRIERTGFDLEQILRRPLNVLGDGVAVRGAEEQGAEDQEIEGALQEIDTRTARNIE